MPNILDINNKEVKLFTNKLREMHRSALPLAVRGTLNDLAFDVKQKTLPQNFKKQFVIRNKSFLKSQSGVQKADGWDINKMQSEVGIKPNSRGSEAAKELKLQEFGGNKLKPLVYMRQARGNSNKRMVKASNYYNQFKKVRGEPTVGRYKKPGYGRRSRKSNFIASAIIAHRLGQLLIWDSKSGQTVFLIENIYLGAGNIVKVKAKSIADFEDKRVLNLKSRPFLLPASNMSQSKIEYFFVKNAKKRFEKIKK